MSASRLVAEATWKEIESTRTGQLLHKFILVSYSSSSNKLSTSFSKRVLKLQIAHPRLTVNFHIAVNDDQLWTLHFIFGKNLEGASRIVDQRGVKRISGEPSGRFVFQVMGESRRKDQYLCFAENFCACYSFFYDAVNRGEQLCCKHQIAARLAASLGACVEVKVSDEDLALLLSKI